MIFSEMVDIYAEMVRCLSHGRFPHLGPYHKNAKEQAINRLFRGETLSGGVDGSQAVYFFDQEWAEIFKARILSESFGIFRLERVDSVGLERHFGGEYLECFELIKTKETKPVLRFAVIRGYERLVEITDEMLYSVSRENAHAAVVH